MNGMCILGLLNFLGLLIFFFYLTHILMELSGYAV